MVDNHLSSKTSDSFYVFVLTFIIILHDNSTINLKLLKKKTQILFVNFVFSDFKNWYQTVFMS